MDKTIKLLIIIACITFISLFIGIFFLVNSHVQTNDESGQNYTGIVTQETQIDCTKDIYNCDNFENCQQVLRVFNQCMNTTGQDIHKIDSNMDGVPCDNIC